MLDEKANIFKVQYLYRKLSCKCGRYKREGVAHYPGRSDSLFRNMGLINVERRLYGLLEVSRGHISRSIKRQRAEPVNDSKTDFLITLSRCL